MADPLTITAIIAGVASAVVAIAGAFHYKLKMRCCMCCQSECTENETERDIRRINSSKNTSKSKNYSVSSIKSI